jgi:hypothetical protein
MVGLQILDLPIGVRVPASQPMIPPLTALSTPAKPTVVSR